MSATEPFVSDDPVTLQAMLAAERVENERLRKIIRELQRHRFGRRAESLPADQLQLGLEEAEQAEAADLAAAEEQAPSERVVSLRKRRANRGDLPAHLPRIESVVDVADRMSLRSPPHPASRAWPQGCSARAARPRCTGSARTCPNASMWCRRRSGS